MMVAARMSCGGEGMYAGSFSPLSEIWETPAVRVLLRILKPSRSILKLY
jgi:hypothetical protein